MSEPSNRRLTPAVWLATGLGVGLVSPAPGTVGALWGLLWSWGLLCCQSPWAWLSVPVGIVLGGPLCGRAARDLGGGKDPQAIVWDEIATVPLVFLGAEVLRGGFGLTPDATGANLWVWLPVGFALHRVFDISKPWPCRRLEQLPGGWGIMTDDVAAGAYGAVVFALVIWIIG